MVYKHMNLQTIKSDDCFNGKEININHVIKMIIVSQKIIHSEVQQKICFKT